MSVDYSSRPVTLRSLIGVALALGASLLAVAPGQTSGQPATSTSGTLPPQLENYLTSVVRIVAAERQRLRAGSPVTKLLDTDPKEEVAVFGAIWIASSPARYVDRVKDIENFERGDAFRITKRISDPPRLEDFDALALTDQDFADLKSCRVGDCEVKLDARSLQRLRTEVNWNGPAAKKDAEAVVRRIALEYVNGYRQGGNARLAVYRDAERPTFVANEFRSMIERLPALATYSPDLRAYLLDYPAASLAESSDFLYWQETEFGLKPTIRINHLTIQDRNDATVVASKMLYASHYVWTALELRVLVPDPSRGSGFWFVTVNRSRSDGLNGFLGGIVRRKVRSEVEKGSLAALSATKHELESKQ